MDTSTIAERLIEALNNSNPEAHFSTASVSQKGVVSTRLVKTIILTRLKNSGCRPRQYKGETYDCLLDDQSARFNFRVTASGDMKEAWTNFSPAELKKLQGDYSSAILTVWHPPGEARWLQQLMVFSFAPREVLAGIDKHSIVIKKAQLETVIRNAQKNASAIPRLMRDFREIGLVGPNEVNLPGNRVAEFHKRVDEILVAYISDPPNDLDETAWRKEKSLVNRQIRAPLWDILVHIGEDPDEAGAYRLYHQKTKSTLLRLSRDSGRFTEVPLHREYESAALEQAYKQDSLDKETRRREGPTTSRPTDTSEDRSVSDEEISPESLQDGPLEVCDPVMDCQEILEQQLFGIDLGGILSQIWTALNAGQHVVITGAPGTAKTTIAETVAAVAARRERCSNFLFTTATTDWTALDTVGGYVPDPRPEHRGLMFQPGKFLECFRSPDSGANDFRWLVVDELNRADVDKAFGQFFTILSGHPCELPYMHEGKRVLVLPTREEGMSSSGDSINERYDGDTFYVYKVPSAWRMLATLNTDDKASLYEMSFAFLRRFAFVHIPLPDDRQLEDICEHVLARKMGMPAERTSRLCDVWRAITCVRPLGPAILIDMAKYIQNKQSRPGHDKWTETIAEAITMYVFPQMEALTSESLRELRSSIRRLDQDYWPPSLDETASAFLPSFGGPHDWSSGTRAADVETIESDDVGDQGPNDDRQISRHIDGRS